MNNSAKILAGSLALAAATTAPMKAHADPPLVAAAAIPAPPPISIPAAPRQPRSKLPAIVLGTFAIASAGAGTVFGALALDDKTRFQKHPTFATADSASENAVVADVCFGAAVAFGMTSLVLLLRGDDTPQYAAIDSHITFSMSPLVMPHGGGAGAILRF